MASEAAENYAEPVLAGTAASDYERYLNTEELLAQMSPWEYQEIRRVLGHGSGFDSPGFARLRHVLPELGEAFDERRREAGLELIDVYVHGREHEELYQLAEALVEL